MIVRPKYSRQANVPRNRKRPEENDMMSTLFAVKMLAVIVFLSVFALCRAADTPATNYFIAKVKIITTENFDANKYLSGAASALGIKLPDKRAIPQEGLKAQESGPDTVSGVEVQATGGLGLSSLEGDADNNMVTPADVNQADIDNNQTGIETKSGDVVTSSVTDYDSGGSSIDDTINAITQVPILGEDEIKAMADKYSFVVPIKGEIESPFGIRTDPLTGSTVFHSGIDIKANMGTSIKAALDGEVTEVGSSPEYDNYVRIKHSDGIYTVYAHCSILVAKVGQKVKQGDVVAKVGDSEGLLGAYLHFEVWKDSKAVDPEKLLNLLNT